MHLKKILVILVIYCSGIQGLAQIQNHTEINTLGLPPLPRIHNLDTPELIALGKQLFFDKNLSANREISCASCHIPEKFFTDGLPNAVGINGKIGHRKTPTLLNVAYHQAQFWDGRRATLEDQVLDPFLNPNEHGFSEYSELFMAIEDNPIYRVLIKQAFQESSRISLIQISQALSAYIRTLIAGKSPFDQYFYGGDLTALSSEQVRGLNLFRHVAQCSTCHHINADYALLTDGDYHSLAIGLTQLLPDIASLTKKAHSLSPEARYRWILTQPQAAALGRFIVTLNPQDIGKFKTPSLRNVALTAPYMHDGSVATLEEALERELYYRGQSMNRPLILTPQEKSDIIAFLKALTSLAFPEQISP